MATKKKPSAAQLAARAKFVEMVRAKSKAKKSATKKATQRKSATKKVSTHKDTKSHNVNIRVMSGIDKTIHKLTREYIVIYDFGHDVSTATFKATSLQEAKSLAQFHKRMTPELKRKKIKTIVKLRKK